MICRERCECAGGDQDNNEGGAEGSSHPLAARHESNTNAIVPPWMLRRMMDGIN